MNSTALPKTEFDPNDSGPRMRYLHEVDGWAMQMLATLRSVPDGADKVTLMRQVDRLKDARRIRTTQLPAYAGSLAILSNKMAGLVQGKAFDRGYRKESVVAMLKSKVLRRRFDADSTQMKVLAEFLSLDHPFPGGH